MRAPPNLGDELRHRRSSRSGWPCSCPCSSSIGSNQETAAELGLLGGRADLFERGRSHLRCDDRGDGSSHTGARVPLATGTSSRETPGAFVPELMGCVSVLVASSPPRPPARFSRRGLPGRRSCTSEASKPNQSRNPRGRFAPAENRALPTDFPDPPGDPDIDLVVLGESSAKVFRTGSGSRSARSSSGSSNT